MKSRIELIKKYGFLALLPLLAGCAGGGSAAFGLGSLFGGGGGGGGIPDIISGEAIATIYQPEPASMLLMGSGLAAMAYFKNKKK